MILDNDDNNALEQAPWHLSENRFDAASAGLHETLFALGNGRIGVRGAHEESGAWPGAWNDAVYVNGFHDVEEIHYPEEACGLARRNEYLVGVPHGKALHWSIDGEAFDPRSGALDDYHRRLDFRTGCLTRFFLWTSPRGRRVSVRSRRIVCFERPSVYAMELELRVLDGPARLQVESSLRDSDLPAARSGLDPRRGSAHAGHGVEWLETRRAGDGLAVGCRTRASGLLLASAMDHAVSAAAQVVPAADAARVRIVQDCARGDALVIQKFCAIVTGETPVFAPQAQSAGVAELVRRALAEARDARDGGFDALCREQGGFLQRWWERSDVEIGGAQHAAVSVQQALRFNLLHLLQSGGRDGRTNIAAKGVTGNGYDGHYFWDTEIYVLPTLLYSHPALARALLSYRHACLDAARRRAAELSHRRGALFPWRTITGQECSAYFPAGTAQYHLNADIAFAVQRYWEATGDDAFMRERGVELVCETARIWVDLGHFETLPAGEASDVRPQRFVIHTVTGPDEYTALVNNNLYTNALARRHLRFACEVLAWLRATAPEQHAQLVRMIGLGEDEPRSWEAAASAMVLPYDPALGIHPQDDGFLGKQRWEVRDIPADKRPLLLHYHPLVIYRQQVCKQADVVLAMLLLGDEFSLADKRRNFDYYEPITTHDSSLSRCIFGILASEVGYHDKAYDYFRHGVRADLEDLHRNTSEGVHIAAMAGAWMGVVMGFAGFRAQAGRLRFRPTLPAAWDHYRFRLQYRSAEIEITVDGSGCRYRRLAAERSQHPLQLQHGDQAFSLDRAQPEWHGCLFGARTSATVPAEAALACAP